MPVNMAMNVIGMPAFVDYYTMHDPETGKIGFVPTKQSLKTDLQAGSPSTSKWINRESAGQPFWVIFLIFFFICAAAYFSLLVFLLVALDGCQELDWN